VQTAGSTKLKKIKIKAKKMKLKKRKKIAKYIHKYNLKIQVKYKNWVFAYHTNQ